jgi:Cu-processing system permease protein
MTNTSVIWLCARQEIVLAVRSRWTQAFAVVFSLFALAVALSGYVLSGGRGFQDFARTAASLVQLVLLLVPLTTLVLGVMSLTPDIGEAELLYSQPARREAILAGKLVGLFIALAAAQSLGFGAAGVIVFARTGSEGVTGFLGVVAGSLALTGVFLAFAAALAGGDTGRRRSRHLASALIVWFATAVLFDIAVLGVASLLPSGLASRTLMIAVLINPVDAVRTAALMAIEGPAAFGSASLAFLRFTGGESRATLALMSSVVTWTAIALTVARVRIGRADI